MVQSPKKRFLQGRFASVYYKTILFHQEPGREVGTSSSFLSFSKLGVCERLNTKPEILSIQILMNL